MYPIEIKLASKNGWFTPQESNGYYKARYAREGITVHWWGDGSGANNHDNIVNYILVQAQEGIKSVNYVLSDNKITMLVNPDNVAWASQGGNPTTVSIEFQPTLGAEGYKKGGWLINQLEQRYGHRMSLYPHNHWFATSCPGTIDINRLRAEADKWGAGGYNTTQGASDEMIANADAATKIYKMLRPNGGPSDGEVQATAGKRTYAEFVSSAQAEIGARDANLRDQAQKLADAQNTVTQLNQAIDQLKTENSGDQKQLKALTAQLNDSHTSLAKLQAQLTAPVAPNPSSNWLAKIIAILLPKKQ